MMRRALVCGASDGIGKAIALALAADGISIIALARRLSALRVLQKEIQSLGQVEATILACDLGRPSTFVSSLAAYLEGQPISILINNSGGPASGPILSADIQDFESAFSQHVL